MTRFTLAVPALLLALLAGSASAADRYGPWLDGTYACVGDTGGKTYKGTVEISETDGVYTVRWTIGKETHVGVGIWENNRLSCSWATEVNGKVVMGVVVYQRERDGTLNGKWTQYPGGGKVLVEVLTPKK